MYSIASWSPSQSDPLTVSYMCQRQSSWMHVAERRRNAALRCDRMRAGRKHLCDAGGAQAGFAAADHRAQTGAAGADHDDVVGVVFDRIGFTVGGGTATAVCGLAVAISAPWATLRMTV